jgi:hypothetical protein
MNQSGTKELYSKSDLSQQQVASTNLPNDE